MACEREDWAFTWVLSTLLERVARLRQASVWEGEGRRGKGKTCRWRGDRGKVEVEGGQNEKEEGGGGLLCRLFRNAIFINAIINSNFQCSLAAILQQLETDKKPQ